MAERATRRDSPAEMGREGASGREVESQWKLAREREGLGDGEGETLREGGSLSDSEGGRVSVERSAILHYTEDGE